MRALRALLGSNRVMLAAAVAVLGMQSPGVQAQSPDVFTHEIRPIMERTCWNCHSDQIQSSGLNLSTREGALQGGSRGPAIVPGRAEESRLYRQLTGIEGPLMPLGVPLTADEIEYKKSIKPVKVVGLAIPFGDVVWLTFQAFCASLIFAAPIVIIFLMIITR